MDQVPDFGRNHLKICLEIRKEFTKFDHYKKKSSNQFLLKF